uniref:Chitin-binding type-2 domain-containing protein n=1 Tax=Steinernema glaseri TaxID=37863 RepID=A0A1I7Y0I2_9BILA
MKVAVFFLLLVFFIVPAQSVKGDCYWGACHWAAFGGNTRNNCIVPNYKNTKYETCPEYSFWYVRQFCCDQSE